MAAPLASYVNCPCEIKSDENVLLATGILAGFYNNELVICDPRCTLALARYNRPVKVYLHSSELGGCELTGKVYISTNSLMRIKDLQMLTGQERRDCFRLAVHLTGSACRASELSRVQSLNRMHELEYDKKLQCDRRLAEIAKVELSDEDLAKRVQKPEIVVPVSYPVQIVDLCAGGMKIKCQEPFRRHDRLIVHLELLGKPAELTCLTVRESSHKDDKGFRAVGCKFQEVGSRQNDLLCSFLLQEQGKQIKKSKSI